MTVAEQKSFVDSNYPEDLSEVYHSLEIEEYRNIENIIDNVNNPIFTRYCVTLLIDELISFETKDLCEEE